MSARRRLVLKNEAQKDVSAIFRYTEARWVEELRKLYRSRIQEGMSGPFNCLRRARRDELFEGCRALLVGRHVVYYHVEESRIVVSRILHSAQEPDDRVIE